MQVHDQTISAKALIDSGADGQFFNTKFAIKHCIPMTPLPRPIPVLNVDGTPNHHPLHLEMDPNRFKTVHMSILDYKPWERRCYLRPPMAEKIQPQDQLAKQDPYYSENQYGYHNCTAGRQTQRRPKRTRPPGISLLSTII